MCGKQYKFLLFVFSSATHNLHFCTVNMQTFCDVTCKHSIESMNTVNSSNLDPWMREWNYLTRNFYLFFIFFLLWLYQLTLCGISVVFLFFLQIYRKIFMDGKSSWLTGRWLSRMQVKTLPRISMCYFCYYLDVYLRRTVLVWYCVLLLQMKCWRMLTAVMLHSWLWEIL